MAGEGGGGRRPSIGRIRSHVAGVTLGLLLLALAPPSLATASAPREAADEPAVASTRLTYLVADCDGCVLFLYGFDADGNGWGTPGVEVIDGRAEVEIDTALTAGLVTVIETPWESGRDPLAVGTPTVVVRYGRQAVGSRMSSDVARSKNRASGCWAGTSSDHYAFRVVVRRVEGSDGTASTLAFTRTTQAWTRPMTAVTDGRLRTFAATPCDLD